MMQIGKFLSSSIGSGWLTLFSAPEVSPEIKALAVDADDNIYLAGERSNSTDGWYAKLSADAQQVFLKRCNSGLETIALGSDGKCYMGYLNRFIQLNPDGSCAIAKGLTDTSYIAHGLCRRLASSATGRLLAQSSVYNNSSFLYVVSSLNFDGSVNWLRRVTGPATTFATFDGLCELSNGSLIAAAQVPNGSYSAAQLVKLDSNGAFVASSVVSKNTSTIAQSTGIVRDVNDNIYSVVVINNTEIWLLKFDSSLVLKWSCKIGAATAAPLYGALGIGADGCLYTFVQEGTVYYIIKISQAGELVFCRRVAPSLTSFFQIFIVSGGFMYLVGRRLKNGYYAPFILKLPIDGTGIGTHALPNDLSVTYSEFSRTLSIASPTITSPAFSSTARTANVVNATVSDMIPDFTQATVMI